MEYRRLGRSGLRVSALSYGSWVTFAGQLAEQSAMECMSVAYGQGVNFFDNAEAYAHGESERIMGSVLKKSGWARDSYCVSSKVFWGGEKPTQRGLSRKHVVDTCHAALKRLQVDYLDLYFCHRPDVHTPVDETVWAMHSLVMQGKVLYWGTSEWSAQQITAAYEIAARHNLVPPSMEQPEYNLFERTKMEHDYLPLFHNYGMGTTIWSPLASGVLTGKYSNGVPKDSRLDLPNYAWLKQRYASDDGRERLRKAKAFAELATRLGSTSTNLALAWCMHNPHVSTVILGASKVSQLEANLKAPTALALLNTEVVGEIDSIMGTKPEAEPDFTAR